LVLKKLIYSCFLNRSNTDVPTPNHWVEIAYQLINADLKAVKYFVLQVLKNVCYYEQQVLL